MARMARSGHLGSWDPVKIEKRALFDVFLEKPVSAVKSNGEILMF